MSKRLDYSAFQTVVASTPLISIDLIIENLQGEALLGQRLNKPAQGYWFVPGGRILKDETIEQAFLRLTKEELGNEISFSKASFIAPFEHFYNDNFSGENFSTHYIVLAFRIKLDIQLESLPKDQHQSYQWFSSKLILTSSDVHLHTKWYFE